MNSEELSCVRKKHDLIMENRKNLSVTGVSDVSGFDDEKVVLTTELGELTVRGSRLHISKFSQDTGELNLDGEIDELQYSESKKDEGGFFSKLFR